MRLNFGQNAHVRATCVRPKIECANVRACEAKIRRNSQLDINDNRVKLEEGENGNTLVISLANIFDTGDYVCQIEGEEAQEIRHSVKIRGKKIHYFLSESL